MESPRSVQSEDVGGHRELAPGAGWPLCVAAQGCPLAESSNIPGWPTPGSRGQEAAGMPGAGGCSQPLGALPEHKVPSVPAIIQEERLFSPGWLRGGPWAPARAVCHQVKVVLRPTGRTHHRKQMLENTEPRPRLELCAVRDPEGWPGPWLGSRLGLRTGLCAGEWGQQRLNSDTKVGALLCGCGGALKSSSRQT